MIDPIMSLRHDLISLPGGAHKNTALYDRGGRRVDDTNIVVTSPNRAVFAKEYARAPAQIDVPQTLDVIEHAVLYIGVARNHYGHFLLDSMSRMWAAMDSALPCVFLGAGDMANAGEYYAEIMSSMNFSVISPVRPTLYRNIWVPAATLTENEIWPDADSAHLRVTERLHPRDSRKWTQPVFLSRRGLHSKARTYLTNEAHEARLEGLLEQYGYRIVQPQHLTFADQIALFNECPKIVGLLGSAFHTAFFSRKSYSGKMAILTFREEIKTKRYGLIDSIKGYSATYIKCCELDMVNKSMAIDVDNAVKTLMNRDFI